MAFIEAATDGILNGTTEVTLVSAPGVGERKIIRTINVFNKDVATVRLVVGVKNGVNVRIIAMMDLPTNNAFNWMKDPIVLDSTSKSLVAYLDVNPTTQPDFYCAYAVAS